MTGTVLPSWQPTTARRGLIGLAQSLNRYLIGIVSDCIDVLELVGEAAIKAGSGETNGRRTALWGIGALALVAFMAGFAWELLG